MDLSMGSYTDALGDSFRTQPEEFGRLQYQPNQIDGQAKEAQQHQQPRGRPKQATMRPAEVNGKHLIPSSISPSSQQPRSGHFAVQPGHHAPQSGLFGILTPRLLPPTMIPTNQQSLPFSIEAPQNAQLSADKHADEVFNGKIPARLVPNPPDLQAWREKLFNVDDLLVLTHEQFETYFPHVDNVYSHRSTQKHKRKPFISHYYDCRMKGRPPGTPKSYDPSKKQRRRVARERDLCDVKIKVMEYFPGSYFPDTETYQMTDGVGQRFWTIQRVNGNGANGKGDGVAGPHKHTLEKSDKIKKNSVQRYVALQEKEAKKTQHPPRRATGPALTTVKKHTKSSDLKLYSACFCPFSQRVWIALQAKGITYQYCETDPYRRPAPDSFLETNPRGKVPAIRQGDWACAESAVILEYLEDMDTRVPLFPSDPRLKANCRYWIEHINLNIVPSFFALLLGDDLSRRPELVNRLQSHLDDLVQGADEEGPLFLGISLSIVDIHLAPFALRLRTIMHPRRGWPAAPTPDTRWRRWLEALEQDMHVRATTSSDEMYADTADILIQNTAPVPLPNT